jgi:hypothetical protein
VGGGAGRDGLGLAAHHAELPRPQPGRVDGDGGADPVLVDRHPDHARHRAVGAVRVDPFFQKVPWTEFFFGTQWSPQIALRADQVGASGAFGAIPLFTGTLLISFIAMLVAVPIGLMSAIYLSEYAPRRVRAWAKPVLEVLAGIPTVVYGFFAALTVAPLHPRAGASRRAGRRLRERAGRRVW